MKTLLIVGVDTVVGANLAAMWADRARVVGLTCGPQVHVAGCEISKCERSTADSVRKCLQQAQPTHVVFCGAAARSRWDAAAKSFDADSAKAWATGSSERGAHFTLISSDAVFTGPWMFHSEDSSTTCDSPEARAIRETEDRVRAACPKSLIVRTNVFGWSPTSANGGWLELLLTSLENNRAIEIDPISHASPILATDLADYLEAALEDELTGVFHIAGAERVSQHQFAERLASAFDLASPSSRVVRELSSRPSGFGRGETSLKTSRFRSEYECSMPLLSEGIGRLLEQNSSGYRDRFNSGSARTGKAA